MARYAVDFQRTASATLWVGYITAEATTRLTRVAIYDMSLGSEATPADAALLWTVQRITSEGTSTGVTPQLLNLEGPVAMMICGENSTIDGTETAGAIVYNLPLNQRATYRWVAAPGGELWVPATDEAGFAWHTPTITSGTPVITAQIHCEE